MTDEASDAVGSVSLTEMVEAATPARRNATICVAGHLVAEYDTLERRLTELVEEARFGDSLDDGGAGERALLAKQMDGVRAQMRAHEGTFTFEYIGAKPWSDLIASEGRGEGEDKDATYLAACLGTLVQVNGKDVTEQDKAALTKLWPKLNIGQRNEMLSAALEANTGRVSVPFSPLAFAARSSTGER